MPANHHTLIKAGTPVHVAMIGTEGAGKTVLSCVLAKRFSYPDNDGVFLEPGNPTTLKYVEQVWATLVSGEWPPSTPPGELFKLKWFLHWPGHLPCEVRHLDAAGQDIRKLFDDDEPTKAPLPPPLEELRTYCHHADVVLFLVNVKDFVGEGASNRRAANEAAIKFAMDRVLVDGGSRRAILVFTQADQYVAYAKKLGNWQNLAMRAMPYIYSAYIRSGRVPIVPVAAVWDTRVSEALDRTPRRVPTPDFRSKGLKELLDVVKEAVEQAERRELARREAEQREAARREAEQREAARREAEQREAAKREAEQRERTIELAILGAAAWAVMGRDLPTRIFWAALGGTLGALIGRMAANQKKKK
jgi:hypothetical protein